MTTTYKSALGIYVQELINPGPPEVTTNLYGHNIWFDWEAAEHNPPVQYTHKVIQPYPTTLPVGVVTIGGVAEPITLWL